MKPTLRQRIYVGAATGVLMAGLTDAVSTIKGISNPALGAVKALIMALIIPGLLGSAIIGGNVHAFSLAAAVVINGVAYFAFGCLLYSLWIGLRKSLWR